MSTRRDRNKARMRERISDVATALFLQRGFDEVSVSEIAEAADVARPTVFAHFPHKEDLLLDRFDDTLAELTGAVEQRTPASSAVAAVADWVVARARAQDLPVGIREEYARFWQVVAGSRALQARARELAEIAEGRLAGAMADGGSPAPALAAALTVAAVRGIFLPQVRTLLAGGAVPDADQYARRLGAALGAVEAAVERLAVR
ncbi:TetR/AcrR family transcriptional regulator [Pseudonocardia sp. DLS-67]